MVQRYSLGMSRLVPEVRINKNGVPVLKHVRPDEQGSAVSSLSSIAPVLNQGLPVRSEDEVAARRAEIVRELMGSVRARFEEQERRLSARVDEGGPSGSGQVIAQLAELTKRKGLFEKVGLRSTSFMKLNGYSLETLERLSLVASSGERLVLPLLSQSPVDEQGFLVYLNFPDNYFLNGELASKVYGDVGRAVGIEDLSGVVPGSGEHAAVSSVLHVASEANRHRMSFFPKDERESRALEGGRAQMTRELAAVIVEHPSRVEDIIGFLRERNVHPSALECESLIDYLRAHQAVSVGSL
jgi:hypothetical protein